VFALANLPGGVRAHAWRDVAEGPQLDAWLEAGLVALTGPRGEDPPVTIPAERCCTGRG